jgi:hypothetical protein
MPEFFDPSDRRVKQGNGAPLTFSERGALFWAPAGSSGWGTYVSWPFSSILITPERVRFEVRLWQAFGIVFKLFDRTFKLEQAFELEKASVTAIRQKRHIFSTSVMFEHASAECPSMMRFWTFRPKLLIAELRRRGWPVS